MNNVAPSQPPEVCSIAPNRLARWFFPLLRVPTINWAVFKLRLAYLSRFGSRLRTFERDMQRIHNPDYSRNMLCLGRTSDRPLRFILPLTSIEAIPPATSRILSVGCRFETELLYLMGYGYRCIRGIDIFSYSPWVDIGDMHSMPYADNSWDCVLLGWVISYSKDPSAAAMEVLRVVRDRGVIAVAVAYYSATRLKELEPKAAIKGSVDRLQTVAAVLSLWQGHVEHVFFQHDAPDGANEGSCIVIFSVRK